MKILITDANILIDLSKTESTEDFFKLEFEIYTTLAVIFECDEKQQRILNRYRKAVRLLLHNFDLNDEEEIEKLIDKNRGLSPADCSVLYTAGKLNAILLSGDRKLRATAEGQELEVHGIFWVFDEMLERKLISKVEYRARLKRLKEVNKWLPEGEFEKRI